MALINPGMLNTVRTISALTSLVAPGTEVGRIARQVSAGATVASMVARPLMSTGVKSSGGTQTPGNSFNSTVGAIKGIETIIIRIETSNAYLKDIAEAVNPKYKNNINILKQQSRIFSSLSDNMIGKFLLNSFGKNLKLEYNRMMKTFGPAIQQGATSHTEIFMYKMLKDNPFFKKFFTKIDDLMEESLNKSVPFNQESRLTLVNIIPTKLDAMINLESDQVKLLAEIAIATQSAAGNVRHWRVEQMNQQNNICDVVDQMVEDDRNRFKHYSKFMKNADQQLEKAAMTAKKLNEQLASMSSAIYGLLDKPMNMIKTVFGWYIRYKVASTIIGAVSKSSSTAKSGTDAVKSGMNNVKSFASESTNKVLLSAVGGLELINKALASLTQTEAFKSITVTIGNVVSSCIRTAFKYITIASIAAYSARRGWKSIRGYGKTAGNAISTMWKNFWKISMPTMRQAFRDAIGTSRIATNKELRAINYTNKNFGNGSINRQSINGNIQYATQIAAREQNSILAAQTRQDRLYHQQLLQQAVNNINLYNRVSRNMNALTALDERYGRNGWTQTARNRREALVNRLIRDSAAAGIDTSGLLKYQPSHWFRNAQRYIVNSPLGGAARAVSGAYNTTRTGIVNAYNTTKTAASNFAYAVGNSAPVRIGKLIGVGVATTVTRIFSLVGSALNIVGIVAMVGAAIWAGIKAVLLFVGKSDKYKDGKYKNNSVLIRDVIVDFVTGAIKSIVKIIGMFFNPRNLRSVLGGIWDGLKDGFKLIASGMLGGIMNLFGLGSYVDKAMTKFGLKEQWKTINGSFNEGKNSDFNLQKTANDIAEEEKKTQDSIAESSKQTADNTLKISDYFKPKNLAISLGYALQKFSGLYGKAAGMIAGDRAKENYTNSVNQMFTNWSNPNQSEIKQNIATGFLGAAEGKSLGDILKNSEAATSDNTAALIANTTALKALEEKRNAKTAVETASRVAKEKAALSKNIVFDSGLKNAMKTSNVPKSVFDIKDTSKKINALLDYQIMKDTTGNFNIIGDTSGITLRNYLKATNASNDIYKDYNKLKDLYIGLYYTLDRSWDLISANGRYKAAIDYSNKQHDPFAFINNPKDFIIDRPELMANSKFAVNKSSNFLGAIEGQFLPMINAHTNKSKLPNQVGDPVGNDNKPNSKTDSKSKFINKLLPAANTSFDMYHVFPSVMLAQAINESGWGKSNGAINKNNFFGIMSCGSLATYPDIESGLSAHGRFLSNNPRYNGALMMSDPYNQIHEISKAGYCTNPSPKDYYYRILDTMQTYNLTKYDKLSGPLPVPPKFGSVASITDDEFFKNIKCGPNVTRSSILALNPQLRYQIYQYAKLRGKPILITSAARTTEQQAALYAKDKNYAAAPGTSLHELGMAVDINRTDLDTEMLRKVGLYRPMLTKEPWHVQSVNLPDKYAEAQKFLQNGSGLLATPNNQIQQQQPKDEIDNFFDILGFMITGNSDIGGRGNQIGDPVDIPLNSMFKQFVKRINLKSGNNFSFKESPLKHLSRIISNGQADLEFTKMKGNADLIASSSGKQIETAVTELAKPLETVVDNFSKTVSGLFNGLIATGKPSMVTGSPVAVSNITNTTPINNNNITASSNVNNPSDSDLGKCQNDMGMMAFMV